MGDSVEEREESEDRGEKVDTDLVVVEEMGERRAALKLIQAEKELEYLRMKQMKLFCQNEVDRKKIKENKRELLEAWGELRRPIEEDGVVEKKKMRLLEHDEDGEEIWKELNMLEHSLRNRKDEKWRMILSQGKFVCTYESCGKLWNWICCEGKKRTGPAICYKEKWYCQRCAKGV